MSETMEGLDDLIRQSREAVAADPVSRRLWEHIRGLITEGAGAPEDHEA